MGNILMLPQKVKQGIMQLWGLGSLSFVWQASTWTG